MTKLQPTNWRGSQITYKLVFDQIKARWGLEMAKRLDCSRNCRTYRDWKDSGFFIRKGERAIQSITFIPVEKNSETKNVIRKKVNLFFFNQLEKILK